VRFGRVQVRGDRDGAFLVGGVNKPVEALGRVGTDLKQPDVIDHDQIGAEDPGDHASDGVVGAVRAHQRAEVFEPEPGCAPEPRRYAKPSRFSLSVST
jgi:hypothetical protein